MPQKNVVEGFFSVATIQQGYSNPLQPEHILIGFVLLS
jgi:hypothetical protein